MKLGLILVVLASTLTANAQHTLAMHNHAGNGSVSACRTGDWNHEIAVYPAAQRGNLNHKVTTNSVMAQTYFDQGLTFFYGFDAQSAMRSFHMASVKDPQLAMAHWGVALAAGGDLNIPIDGDCMRLAIAESGLGYAMRGKASAAEQQYIVALMARYATPKEPGPDKTVRDVQQMGVNYMLQMKQVSAALGATDPDAPSLYAYSLMNLRPWLWWTTDGKQSGEITEALRVLRDGLKIFPKHLGLNHILIHAQEEGPVPEAASALPSAEFLFANAPFITPHLNHMPAHIFLLTGQWDKVVQANVNATRADQPWTIPCATQPFTMDCNQLLVGHYYSHDMLFLDVGLANQGQWAPVADVSKQVEENARKFVATQPDLEHYLTTRTMMMTHFGRWNELATLAPPEMQPGVDLPQAQFCAALTLKLASAVWYFGRGMADASLGKDTGDDVKGFTKAQGCVGGSGWGNNTAADILTVVHWRLLERIARTGKDLEAARTFALLAVESEDLLNYDEPPGWYVSSRETYGAALMLSGKYAEALAVFKVDQEKRPKGSLSLYGIWQALLALKSPEAGQAKAEFLKQWKSPDFPKMEDM